MLGEGVDVVAATRDERVTVAVSPEHAVHGDWL